MNALQRLAAAAPQLIEHEDRALSAEVVRELRRMSGGDRDALLLVVWGELELRGGSYCSRVPIGTVKSRIARARRALAAAVGPLERSGCAELRETKLFSV